MNSRTVTVLVQNHVHSLTEVRFASQGCKRRLYIWLSTHLVTFLLVTYAIRGVLAETNPIRKYRSFWGGTVQKVESKQFR
jgi:hypothetical protein